MMRNQHLETFLQGISNWNLANTVSDVRYVAAKIDNSYCLVKGRLYLSSNPEPLLPQFKSRSFIAGAFRLEEVGLELQSFIERLIDGGSSTPNGEIPLTANQDGTRPTAINPFHEEGLQNQNRLPFFSIYGEKQSNFTKYPEADWDVMASETPFSNFQELLNYYGLGHFIDDRCVFDIVALPAIAVDKLSIVSGTRAELAILMSDRLDAHEASLGYRVLSNGMVADRCRVSGTDLNWSPHEFPGILRGKHACIVPNAAVIQCFTNYAGETHHFWWFADPETSQNPRRAIYEIVDSKLSIIETFLTNSGKGNARDLEFGVAWLLWMLGFSVAHLGGVPKMQDAVDLVVATPSGNLAVIECTTGLLKAENKMANLVARAAKCREKIAKTGQSHLKVMQAIVTSCTREEVIADVEAAERLGILVIAQENLLEALSQTLQFPDPERLYREGEQAVAAAVARYRTAE